MNQKVIALLGLAAFAVVLISAVLIFNVLSSNEDITPDNILIMDIQDATEPQDTAEPQEEQYVPEEQEQLHQSPNFTMLDAYGNEMQLSDFFGKPIVLNFWATWCPSCVRETHYFENLYQEYGDSVHVLKINLLDGRRETRGRVDNFMYQGGYTFPLYFDNNNSGARAFGIQFVPVTFFINADGYIAAMAQGAVNGQTLEQGLGSILGDA